jgi:hypothetical protein
MYNRFRMSDVDDVPVSSPGDPTTGTDADDSTLQAWETAHKNLFQAVIEGARMRTWLKDTYGLTSPEFVDYNAIWVPYAAHWAAVQMVIENHGLEPKSGLIFPDVLTNGQNGIDQMQTVADNWAKGLFADGTAPQDFISTLTAPLQQAYLDAHPDLTQGMEMVGFIPLIIWGIILIVGFISSAYMVHETHKEAQDQIDLTQKTSDFCTQHNLSPADCMKALQGQTTSLQKSKDSSASFLGLIPTPLLWGIAIWGGYKVFVELNTMDNSNRRKRLN